jgi:hypothetical protein
VVDGKGRRAAVAPAIVVSAMGRPFDPLKVVSGRLPSARGEVVINRKLAADEHLVS